MDLSSAIEAIRREKRISKADMAKRLDMDSSNYHRLEGRGDKLTIEQARLIANALELNLVDLLTWGEKQENASNDRIRNSEIIEKLEDRIKEIKISRDILQEYVDSNKVKLSALQKRFEGTLTIIGYERKIGTVHIEEQTQNHVKSSVTFSDEELKDVIQAMRFYKNDMYGLYYFLIQNNFLDNSSRETKLFIESVEEQLSLFRERRVEQAKKRQKKQ